MAVQLMTIGDSFAEGRGDPLPDGTFRGWVPQLADALGIPADAVVNLGSYGATTQDVVDHQLARALSADAPLYGVTVGGNDLVSRDFDAQRFRYNLRHILTGLTLRGARVFTITWPDIPGKLPGLSDDKRRALRARFAEANDYMTKLTAELGVLAYDMVDTPVTRDPAMWAPDGMHPSPEGHRTIAAGIAALLG
ncbi:lysophospholipase L1-like esterase [Thermocatellispora tengchongensis]|uniref:Lysophospholipase L1-like esterase n=1 Tax=Thermocatellispora tengchongensis TaxID=1073253 RepID=A0A840PJS3_9ACTN|nr:SGNH/GDSL hydrolase family protein [Thermocatellispora tengchongensis]MBB5139209.1 lysophospholipase L1-like esterase [Thermocatellispora tengchongensis]